MRRIALGLLLVLVSAAGAVADLTNPSTLTIKETSPSRFTVELTLPVIGGRVVKAKPVIPDVCVADGAPEVRMVKVIESRPVSNAIAEALGVEHKSPQLILVRERKALWSTSHFDISAKNIIFFRVRPDGSVTVKRGESQEEQVIPYDQVEVLLRQELAQNANLIAAIKTDGGAAYRHMVNVLDEVKLAGAERISLQMLEE